MNIHIKYKNLTERGESTEAYYSRIRIFYKIITQIEGVASQNRGCASYL